MKGIRTLCRPRYELAPLCGHLGQRVHIPFQPKYKDKHHHEGFMAQSSQSNHVLALNQR